MKRSRFPTPPALLTLLLVMAGLIASRGRWQTAEGVASASPGSEAMKAANVLSLQLENYAAGLDKPVGIASAGDMRLFVLQQAGQIRIVHEDGTVQDEPFLDISGRVDDSESEEGLLGLAFHPRYYENGYFYVNYTNTTDGVRRTRISRFSVSADPNVAQATSEHVLLTVEQPAGNHNAGRISFGPDHFLYIPLGDGGSGGDPWNNAQTMDVLLGKISRIDVDKGPGFSPDCPGLGTGDYTIPDSNPFVDGPGKNCDEIWANGLRNPWQSTFDLRTGDLFVADVGQSKIEEVNFQPAVSAGGENYGWRCYEGSSEYDLAGCSSNPDVYTYPIFEYDRQNEFPGSCSVTGGYVYRGSQFPAMYGRYFLTDYCSGLFWDLQQQANGNWLSTVHTDLFPPGTNSGYGNASFGQRCDGELFVANRSVGRILHLTGHGATPDSRAESLAAAAELTSDPWIYLPMLTTSSCRW